ncbi:MAG: acyl-CoA dehydrogenase family protein [Deltaproteobacteria bacterium]|nr:acyl-CoA dehydrogenase family protein [Deltaproteobacteria bacterium]
MEFRFSPDEDLLRWAVRDFAERAVGPKDPDALRRSFRPLVKTMGSLGYLGLGVPEEYGGNPGNRAGLGVVVEEVARTDLALAHFVATTYEVTLAVARYGSGAAKEAWLPRLAGGEALGCVAVTEPGAGVDFGALASTAEREGGSCRVDGEKAPVSFGLEADVALTLATAGGAAAGLLVPLDLPGVERRPWHGTGLALAAPASLRFREVRVPAGNLLEEGGGGLALDREVGVGGTIRKALCALATLGAAQTALKHAVRYGRERHAFGRAIGKFEGVSEKIAEDATLVEAARWLCYRALFLLDEGKPAEREAAMCGWWGPKVAYRTLQDALLVHGHAGFCDDHPFQQMWRDVVAFELLAGPAQLQRLAISRDLSGAAGVPDELAGALPYL